MVGANATDAPDRPRHTRAGPTPDASVGLLRLTSAIANTGETAVSARLKVRLHATFDMVHLVSFISNRFSSKRSVFVHHDTPENREGTVATSKSELSKAQAKLVLFALSVLLQQDSRPKRRVRGASATVPTAIDT